MAQNHVQSINSFLNAHYETLALDLAVQLASSSPSSSYSLETEDGFLVSFVFFFFFLFERGD
jgi:hypothetical protein